jgi:cell volume regulation protein A
VIRPDVWGPALILAALLVLLIRPVLVGPLLLPIRLAWGERAFVLLAGLKGAVPILLGILIREADVPGAERIAAIIFDVVILSVIVQGGLLPQLASWFRVPMRKVEQQPYVGGLRFNQEPQDLQRFVVDRSSPADGASVSDLSLGEDGWISLVRRNGVSVPLRGGTTLQEGDEVLAFADSGRDVAGEGVAAGRPIRVRRPATRSGRRSP